MSNKQQQSKSGQAKKPVTPKSQKPSRASANVTKSDLAVTRTVSAPVAQAKVARQQKPRFEARLNGDVMIRHREYLQDVSGSVAFAATTVNVNPGLSLPWLSSIAPRWESYRFDRLRFCFETEAPTTATGTLLLSVDYDASDAAPTSKQQAMAYRSSVRSAPWSNCCHDSAKEDLHKRLTYFVRAGALAANQDIKLYDVANLFVCTQGQASTATIGELYAEYDVLLLTPQLSDVAVGQSFYAQWTNAAATNAAPFGNTMVGNLRASLASTGTTTSVTTITFTAPWSGLVNAQIQGTGLNSGVFTGTSTRLNQTATLSTTTNYDIYVTVVAQSGDTLILTEANTTITYGQIIFAQGSFV
jgi:hypothetical protein